MKYPTWPVHSFMKREDLGLERVQKLLDALGNPEKKMAPVFHVAGTNGKGSTTTFLKSILEAYGYTVHRNTSPHLVRFNERIEICGKEITDEYYNELADKCKSIMEKNNITASWCEIVTAIAFMAFAENPADATIVEVGLGGRLDATNVVQNLYASIITPISYDHTKTLGDTLSKIAFEKAGIIKEGVPCVIAKQPEETSKVINEIASKKGSPTYEYGKNWMFKQINDSECYYEGIYKMIKTPLPSLLGEHQLINAGSAITALLCQNKITVSENAIRTGITKAFWKARLQNLTNTKFNEYIDNNTLLYIDGCHNEGAATVIANWLDSENKKDERQNILILSMLERKDTKAFVHNIAHSIDRVIIMDNNHHYDEEEKYRTIDEFKEDFAEAGFDMSKIDSTSDILDSLKKTQNYTGKKRVLICGSLYFSGDVLELIEDNKI